MPDHEHAPIFERHCDVAVVGGSAAGLAAALQLLRQRRSVIVIDAGAPRNAPAAHLHGYLGRDGVQPARLVEDGRAEVRGYGGEVLDARAVRVDRADSGDLRVELVGGHVVLARRVLAATGLVDVLPEVDGLADQWGRGVVNCPFCHGFEVRDRRIVQLVDHPLGLHAAMLYRQLTADLTLIVDESIEVDPGELELLRAGGVDVRPGRGRRVVSDGADGGGVRGGGGVDGVQGVGGVVAVELIDGSRLPADVVAVGTRFAARAEPFAPLGLHPVPHATGLGDVVEVDADGATAVAGLYAAGNLVDPTLQLLAAAADGSRVGAVISMALAQEDLRVAARPAANEADWDHRYGGELMWSGNPNGTLVAEVGAIAPGSALDVGAGEGGDALWLAEQGWRVTASDVSGRGLRHVAAQAERRGLTIECRHVDANSFSAFPPAAFDLVSAQYASIPRTPDDRGIHNLLDAVAPGGTLLIVSHDLAPLRTPIDAERESRPFDPDAFVRVEHVASVLQGSPSWAVEVFEKRPRPAGAASAAHHVDDLVLRARRLGGSG